MTRPAATPTGPGIGLVVAGLLFGAGCASPVYRAYDGNPRPAAEVATVAITPEIDVLRIEGRAESGLRTYLPGHPERIELLPGTNTIEVRYSSIFRTGHDDHETFYSRPVTLTFEARPGGRYRVAHDPVPEDPVAARAPRDVDLWLEETRGGTPVAAVPRPVQPVPPSPAPQTARPAAAPTPEDGAGNLDALSLLQFWWERADDQQRSAFLEWVEP